MAGYDAIAVLCLLLAGAGGVYLFRASRKAKPGEASDGPPADDPADRKSRNAPTIPPKLRPPDREEPSKRDDPPSAPAPKVEGAGPQKKDTKRSGPSSHTSRPVKATLVSSGDDEVSRLVAERASEKKIEIKSATVNVAADAAKKAEPVKTAEPAKAAPAPAPAPASAKTAVVERKPEPARAPAAEKKAEPAKKAPPPAPKAALPKSEPKLPAAKPAAPPPSQKLPAAKPATAALKPAKITPKTTIVAGSNAPLIPAPQAGPLPSPLQDLPKLQLEEDEDVEPTRVGRVVRKEIQPPVEKHIVDEGADTEPPKLAKPLQVVYAIAQTDPGRRRKQNEDSYLLLEKEGVFVVADGMGGHRGGQIASKLAVKTIGDAFEKKTFEAKEHVDLPLVASELARSMQMANAAIHEEASAQADLKGMGTTLVSARFTADAQRLYIGHVGDSRVYRIRDGAMKQITTDHTMADYGVAGPEGAHLSRAVGVWPTVPIDILMAKPELGDHYLLCSDGLTKMLTNETIATQIVHEDDPKAAVSRLVMFANAHGGKDNITVVLIRIVAPDWAPPA